MRSIKLQTIQELAQDFLRAPRISQSKGGLSIVYDYEMDSGEYGEKSIFFQNVLEYRHTDENHVKPEMIDAAYNSISKIMDSEWVIDKMSNDGYTHFLIYFDGYGAFEVIAKDFKTE